VPLLAIVLIVAALLCPAIALVRRKRFLDLNWPRTIGYHTFNGLVYRYLARHGWEVLRQPAVHVAVAKKPGQVILLHCMCSTSVISDSIVHDLTEEVSTRGVSLLIVVTANEVPPHLLSAAAHGRALILHYKKLSIFADHGVNQLDAFAAMRVSMLEAFP
jgi:hypothetical protein